MFQIVSLIQEAIMAIAKKEAKSYLDINMVMNTLEHGQMAVLYQLIVAVIS